MRKTRVKERRRRSAGLVLLRPADLGPHLHFCPEISHAIWDADFQQKLEGQLEIRYFTVCQERRLNNTKEIPAGVGVAGDF